MVKQHNPNVSSVVSVNDARPDIDKETWGKYSLKTEKEKNNKKKLLGG